MATIWSAGGPEGQHGEWQETQEREQVVKASDDRSLGFLHLFCIYNNYFLLFSINTKLKKKNKKPLSKLVKIQLVSGMLSENKKGLCTNSDFKRT